MKTATVMDLRNLRRGDLNELAAMTFHPCVSIYMPTHRRGKETRQDSIRFRNLLDQAAKALSDAGYETGLVESLRGKQEDNDFWQHQSDGLGVLANRSEITLLRLPYTVDERVEIDEVPFLKPLLPTQTAG